MDVGASWQFVVDALAAERHVIAPVATWAGVTRTDEPGCEDDPANHRYAFTPLGAGAVIRALDGSSVAPPHEVMRIEGATALVVAVADDPDIDLVIVIYIPPLEANAPAVAAGISAGALSAFWSPRLP